MANVKGLAVTVFASQTAWIILFCVDKAEFLRTQSHILMPVGCLFLLFAIFMFKHLLPSKQLSSFHSNIESRGLLYYTCCLFSWSCVAHFIFYLEALEFIKGFLASYYLKTDEPYLATSFGTLNHLWDSTIHYSLYLRLIYCIDNGIQYHSTVLFYVGSMLSSEVCLCFGSLAGSFASYYPCALLNLPFLILPIHFLLKAVHEPQNMGWKSSMLNLGSQTVIPQKSRSGKPILCSGVFHQEFMRFVISFAIIVSIIYSTIRGLGALGSPLPISYHYANYIEPYLLEPAKYGSVWVLMMLFVGCIFQMYTLYALYHPGCLYLLPWSIVFTGFSAQGSAMMFAQFCSGVDYRYNPPVSTKIVVILGNMFTAFVFMLVPWLVLPEKEFFRRPKSE